MPLSAAAENSRCAHHTVGQLFAWLAVSKACGWPDTRRPDDTFSCKIVAARCSTGAYLDDGDQTDETQQPQSRKGGNHATVNVRGWVGEEHSLHEHSRHSRQ